MPDIVERLRDAAMNAPVRGSADALLLDEAATEIERLRYALARAIGVVRADWVLSRQP
jgi:hypothetical protein